MSVWYQNIGYLRAAEMGRLDRQGLLNADQEGI